MGSPTVIADITSPGPTSQIAARLLDVAPGGDAQTLVARGLYRPATPAARRQVFQLHPNGWKFEEGHVAKLELLANDAPYGRPSNGQGPITVSNLELRLPVLEQPNGGMVCEPAAKVVPAGYQLAPGYSASPASAQCVSATSGGGEGAREAADPTPAPPVGRPRTRATPASRRPPRSAPRRARWVGRKRSAPVAGFATSTAAKPVRGILARDAER